MAQSKALAAALMVILAIASAAKAEEPGSAEVERYYPEQAQREEVEGAVDLRCVVTPEGRVTDCTVEREAPPGLGFGEAAIRLSSQFRMKPNPDMGPTERGTVLIPVKFALPTQSPATP